MLKPAANEIDRLVRRMGSRHRGTVDGARARLSIIGARAVESLIHALEAEEDRVRARIMPLLALIADPRGREPLVAMLLDRSPRLRMIAAQSLARFSSADTVAALRRALERDRSGRVRSACLQSLVELYAAGQEQALAPVLERLTDPNETAAVRASALALLPHLTSAERRSLLGRLTRDPEEAVRLRAKEFSRRRAAHRTANAEPVSRLLEALGSEEYPVWDRAVRKLGARGALAIPPLLEAMQSRSHDPEYCTRAGMALKAMGPRRARALSSALEDVNEPLPLQVLVDVVGALGEKALIYRLKDLIDRLAISASSGEQGDGFEPLQRVRARAHLELARIGSRVAVLDLRNALTDRSRRIELEMVSAIELVGKRDEILILLDLWNREDPFVREQIAEAVRSIMRRERVRRNSALFRDLAAADRTALRTILPPRPNRRPRETRAPGS